ncbi:MAG: hypothetical protein IKK43_01215 [Clostridia bacterium]|nr:hypothetical protein [Clostridia bacterium]
MWLLALVLLVSGSSYWWIPLLFGNRDRRRGCGCLTFVIGAIVGGLIIIGLVFEGGMIY